MADDPTDLAIVDGVDVAKADVRDLLKNYVELRVSQPSVIQNNDFSGRSGGIYVRSLRSHFEVDLADSTTADDGVSVLIDSAGNRWKAIDGFGTTQIDFGSAGAGEAEMTVTITAIADDAVVRAWVMASESDDRDADEHWVDPPIVTAGDVVAGEGFTIHGVPRSHHHILSGAFTVAYEWKNP